MYAACYTSEAFTKVAVTLCAIAVSVAEEWTLYIVYSYTLSQCTLTSASALLESSLFSSPSVTMSNTLVRDLFLSAVICSLAYMCITSTCNSYTDHMSLQQQVICTSPQDELTWVSQASPCVRWGSCLVIVRITLLIICIVSL